MKKADFTPQRSDCARKGDEHTARSVLTVNHGIAFLEKLYYPFSHDNDYVQTA